MASIGDPQIERTGRSTGNAQLGGAQKGQRVGTVFTLLPKKLPTPPIKLLYHLEFIDFYRNRTFTKTPRNVNKRLSNAKKPSCSLESRIQALQA
ncbi:hypothetical protein [Pseudomonas amygdali]|uniref:hypothetical protein n=1 Tax=Pseudomonas amygdali TaxID=47877 RepID=UPI000B2F75D7|nr:hypothetical protein [Pseudomonas amygdali]